MISRKCASLARKPGCLYSCFFTQRIVMASWNLPSHFATLSSFTSTTRLRT